MPSFKEPSFQERAALAANARKSALKTLRDKPPIDESVVAARQAAQQARDEAQVAARAEKLAEREREKAERKARAEAAAAPKAPPPPALTDAEKKALRDARYAARKKRAGKG